MERNEMRIANKGNHDVLSARGRAIYQPKGIEKGTVELDGRVIQLPAVLFAFWNQFQQEYDIDVAKESFIRVGFSSEHFDQLMNILLQEGLLIKSGEKIAKGV